MKTRVLKNTELQRVPDLRVPAEGLQVELTAKAASLFYHQGVIESVAMEDHADVAMENKTEVPASDAPSSPDKEPAKPAARQPHRRTLGRRGQRAKRRGHIEKKRGQKSKRRGQEDKKEGVTVKRTWSGGKRRWDKKHYCVFCRRPQVKIARHLLRKHADEQEVLAASTLPTGSKERHLLLEHLRCRGNYLHNIEVSLCVLPVCQLPVSLPVSFRCL